MPKLQKILPQLATRVDNLALFLGSEHRDNWALQQKVDGRRVMVNCEEGSSVVACGRGGEELALPQVIETSLNLLKGEWLLDGEITDSTYWVFDVLVAMGHNVSDLPWVDRQAILTKLFDKIDLPKIKRLPWTVDDKTKVDLTISLAKERAEGLVFKSMYGPYTYGRSDSWRKYKFIKTVDCIVIDSGANNKDNFVLGVKDEAGCILECGKVSALTGDGPKVRVGDVVEVSILYVTDSNKLYQPTSPKIRIDKSPDECGVDQLEAYKTNKKVHETL